MIKVGTSSPKAAARGGKGTKNPKKARASTTKLRNRGSLGSAQQSLASMNFENFIKSPLQAKARNTQSKLNCNDRAASPRPRLSQF
jgi:hypothetical protein